VSEQKNLFDESHSADNAFDAGPRSPGEVDSVVAGLDALLGAGDVRDENLRRAADEKLTALRALYRARPELFAASTLAALRRIAETLKAAGESPTASLGPRIAVGGTPEDILKSVFGYESFRIGQREIIDAVLAGKDTIGVMPTGAGKSLTYQIPARILGGTTLVVSPLIALMKDQVDAMREIGMRATFLNSSLEPEERRARVEALRRGEYELVYAAPEGLEASVGSALRSVEVSLIAVDEAHCISQWGHDFRPAYRNLVGLKDRFRREKPIPILALTATATHEVTEDIGKQLAMTAPVMFRGSFYRSNLKIHAYKKTGKDGHDGDGSVTDTRNAILRLVRARAGQAGIIYCLSRKSVESTAEYLRDHGIKALAYHAGLDADVRTKVQDKFRKDDVDVICATVAFGMGIDKSNIRYVIHRDMPRSIEGYYQEIGRAGRDGVDSDCVLFYSWADVISYERFASDSDDPEVAEWHRARVREMFRFADKPGCRHQALVKYFGETIEPCGGSCDSCLAADVVGATPEAPRKKRGRSSDEMRPATAAPAMAGADGELFLKLKTRRKRIADAKGLPAYIVFSDAALLAMASKRPQTEEEFLAIPGVGPKKLAQYGAEFLALIREG